MPDVITIGNALIDAFLTVHDENIHVRHNKGDNELAIRLGEKILLDSTHFLLGGDACNVAVGLSRAGFSTGILAEIGDDAFGSKIMEGLSKENIATDGVQQKGESSFAIGIQFQGDRTLFVQHHEREHAFALNEIEAKLVFLTSFGKKWHHIYEGMSEAKKKASYVLALNPGTPQLAEGRAHLSSLLEVTDILFVNKEEAQALLSVTEEDPPKLLSLLSALGPRLVVVMDGENGSYAMLDKTRYFLPATKTEIVEKTGAGDSWTSGFLASYLRGNDIPTCMRYGNANAVSVIGKIGAQAGLLTSDMLEQTYKKMPEVDAEQL